MAHACDALVSIRETFIDRLRVRWFLVMDLSILEREMRMSRAMLLELTCAMPELETGSGVTSGAGAVSGEGFCRDT